MAKSNPLRKSAEIFSALGDETRLGLVHRLLESGGGSITELTAGLPMSRQAATRHLRVLEAAGIVTCEKVGRESHLQLDKKPLQSALSLLEDVERRWDQRLARLKLYAENTD